MILNIVKDCPDFLKLREMAIQKNLLTPFGGGWINLILPADYISRGPWRMCSAQAMYF